MTQNCTRRRLLVLAPLLGLAGSDLALALDFSLRRLEDLRDKWASVGPGASAALVVKAMGEPNTRTETETLGVQRMTLEWKDILGFRYTARFLAGYLFDKQMTDAH